jgi:hypothetical protein
VKKLLLTGIAALFLATPSSAEKMTMQCGDLEVLVVVKRNPDTGLWTKIDVYPANPNMTMRTDDKQLEVRDCWLHINDKKCIATKHWICFENDKGC